MPIPLIQQQSIASMVPQTNLNKSQNLSPQHLSKRRYAQHQVQTPLVASISAIKGDWWRSPQLYWQQTVAVLVTYWQERKILSWVSRPPQFSLIKQRQRRREHTSSSKQRLLTHLKPHNDKQLHLPQTNNPQPQPRSIWVDSALVETIKVWSTPATKTT